MPVTVCAWLDFRGDQSTRAMRSLDLSTEGARFATIRPVVADDWVMVRLEVRPGRPAVECKGRICWVEPMQDRVRHFGLRFIDLAEDEYTEIERALKDSAGFQPMTAV